METVYIVGWKEAGWIYPKVVAVFKEKNAADKEGDHLRNQFNRFDQNGNASKVEVVVEEKVLG